MAVKREKKKENAMHIACSGVLVLLSRSLFLLHGALTFWRVTDVVGSWYWYTAAIVVVAIVEICWVMFRRQAREWTWFSFPVMLYLGCILPGIWLLRMDQIDTYRNALVASCNTTLTDTNDSCNGMVNVAQAVVSLSTKYGLTIPIRLDPNTWLQLLEQSAIFILIVTRWIAPFGRVSHRKLSDLLFVYVGLGSDIVELFVLFEEPYVLQRDMFVYWILSVWSVSLTQFMLPLTGAMASSNQDEMDGARKRSACRDCMRSEAWTIVAIVMLQDGPFLSVRLYIMVVGGLVTYNLAFFTVKNLLVVLLQIYRFIVLVWCVDSATGRSVRRRRRHKDDQLPVTSHNQSGLSEKTLPGDTAPPSVKEESNSEHHNGGFEAGHVVIDTEDNAV